MTRLEAIIETRKRCERLKFKYRKGYDTSHGACALCNFSGTNCYSECPWGIEFDVCTGGDMDDTNNWVLRLKRATSIEEFENLRISVIGMLLWLEEEYNGKE